MKSLRLLFTTFLFITIFSCDKDDNSNEQDFTFPETNTPIELPFKNLLTLPNNAEVRNGGFGSAMVAHPTKKGHFYCLTDRGPNAKYTGSAGKGKKFPVPNYTPRIGHFKLNAKGEVELVEEILLKDPTGNNISGRPNPEGKGTTGEVPYDNNGTVLEFDNYGVDGEGIVALANGEFWIGDEYGPHIIHYSANGTEIERISPVGVDTGTRKLPAVLKRRRPNRGMEGLTITPDEKMLVGIMQSSLYNPSKADVANPTLTRIVTFDITTAETKQYLYRQEKEWNANSEITAIDNHTFLVIERDSKYAGEGDAQKHIYRIDIKGASDVSGEFNNEEGITYEGKTLEQMTWDEIKAQGIKTVSKQLVIDLVSKFNYPHDKLEGIWLIDNSKIGVINDDDFAVSADGDVVIQKVLPSNKIDASTLYIVDVDL